jgi:hypothetical protein
MIIDHYFSTESFADLSDRVTLQTSKSGVVNTSSFIIGVNPKVELSMSFCHLKTNGNFKSTINFDRN